MKDRDQHIEVVHSLEKNTKLFSYGGHMSYWGNLKFNRMKYTYIVLLEPGAEDMAKCLH
jgi:hypothetical protein